MSKPLLNLKPAAVAHFTALLEKEQDAGQLHLRIEVNNPGTLQADVGITFCPAGDQDPDDLAINFPHFILYVDQNSVPALRDATIDYKTNDNNLGGQLSVNAPFIKGAAPNKDAPLRERVQYIIDSEINPNLASHGGFVSLQDIVDNTKVVVRFGGGCHGCGMADVTLKSGIEKTLRQQCPDITDVLDATDHALGENPYYVKGS
ncbi:MAG TPA: NifU family protein [Gammaproteobacteria bacterium]|nr:NifU family protein [Gammaproteobacteria bacterium]